MAVQLTPLALTYYVLIGAAVVALLMAILNVGNIARAAGLICLAVAIAVVGLIVQGNDSGRMVYIAGFALLAAIALMGGYVGGGNKGHDGGGGGEHH
jgi:amino acid permease